MSHNNVSLKSWRVNITSYIYYSILKAVFYKIARKNTIVHYTFRL